VHEERGQGMGSIIKCGTCGGVIKSFNDDCPACLAKENAPTELPEMEILFPKEKEMREKKEYEEKRRENEKK